MYENIDFILVANKPYPKNQVEVKLQPDGSRVYIIIEDKLKDVDIEQFQKIVQKEEIFQITKALLWYLQQPIRTMIAIAIAGVFAGTYLKMWTDNFFAWLDKQPPSVVEKFLNTFNMVLTIAAIAGTVYMIWRRRRE